MRPLQCLVSLLLLCFIAHSAHAAYKPTHEPGPRKVETLLADWVDAARDNWKEAQGEGFETVYWQHDANGRWQKKA